MAMLNRRGATPLRMSWLRLFATALVTATTLPDATATSLHAEARRCTLLPGSTLAVVRVEQDTLLPLALAGAQVMSASSVRPGPHDSLLATPSTLMPAARVRVLQLDSSTRAIFVANGITDTQPRVFIRAAPYRADCRTIRWTDTVPFVVRGEVGYVRATLAPRERWIDGVPVLVIPDAWNYPYPRRGAPELGVSSRSPLAPAEAMFSLSAILETPPLAKTVAARVAADSLRRTRAIAWARANTVASEMEPARTLMRRAVLDPDWEVAERIPSRLRGTYRVDLEAGSVRSTWFFRTHDRPGYVWNGGDPRQSTDAMLASSHILGYRLVGYAGGAPDSLPNATMSGAQRVPLVWLATTDRPTAPGNDAQRALRTIFEFTLAAAAEALWNDLEPLVPRMTAGDSMYFSRMNRQLPRSEKQPQIPLTLRLDARGGIRADTTLIVGGRELRVSLVRIDTLSRRRGW